MPARPLLLALALCLTGTLPSARAALAWERKTIDLQADARTEVLEARFRFANTGPAPVDIRQVESSCGCTTVELAKRHYEPGEHGEIIARYTVGGHLGKQTKTIAVAVSGQPDFTTLTLVAHLPEVARLDPPFVTWTHGEAARPKTITLEMLQEVAPDAITVQSSNAGVAAEIRPVVKNHKYELLVTPARTGEFLRAVLTIRCRFGGEDHTFRTYATVQPALAPD